MKQIIEVFTAGCQVCTPVVELVRSVVNKHEYEVVEYDLVKQCESQACLSKVKDYNIRRLPAIALNGKLLACCSNVGITKEDLINADIA
jgi:hypothetical protein